MRRDAPRRATIARALLLAVGVIALGRTAAADEGGARALVKRVLDAAPDVPFTATMTLTNEGGVTRELAVSHKRVGDARATYLEVTAPLNIKDTRFLFLERVEGRDEQFLYVPAMKRVGQVGKDARKQPFLGSEFYVSDLVTPALDDFRYSATGTAEFAGRHCELVEAIPKEPEDALYSKSVLAIDAKDLVIVRAQFFDKQGKPLKVWTAERLEQVDGIWTVLDQRMVNQQEDVTSRLTLGQVHFHAEIPDTVFSRAHLGR